MGLSKSVISNLSVVRNHVEVQFRHFLASITSCPILQVALRASRGLLKGRMAGCGVSGVAFAELWSLEDFDSIAWACRDQSVSGFYLFTCGAQVALQLDETVDPVCTRN